MNLLQIVDADGRAKGEVPELSRDLWHRMYRGMRRTRAIDERMMILQRQGRISFYGGCTGQEATPIAAAAVLEPSDWVFPGLREGAIMLERGYPLETFLCQVFGNRGDAMKGRQMPSHYSDRRVNQVSWSSCIGTQIPHAVGAAWAAKLKKTGEVVATFFGDGATSSGDFHAGMNFAGVYRVPCVLVCQNNHWSISVPAHAQTAAGSIAEKAVAYGIPFARVDGNDIVACYVAMREAVDRARRGEGPSFLEMVTYRIGSHSSSDDPRVYRDDAEVEAWKARDPIPRLRKLLTTRGLWSDADEERLVHELASEIHEALRRAEAHPPQPPESLFDDVYAELPAHLLAQRADHLALRGR